MALLETKIIDSSLPGVHTRPPIGRSSTPRLTERHPSHPSRRRQAPGRHPRDLASSFRGPTGLLDMTSCGCSCGAASPAAGVRVWQIASRRSKSRLACHRSPNSGDDMTEPTDPAVLLQRVSELLIQSPGARTLDPSRIYPAPLYARHGTAHAVAQSQRQRRGNRAQSGARP